MYVLKIVYVLIVLQCSGISEAKVWTLERRVFQKIMVGSGRREQEYNMRFLGSVPLLKGIHQIELAKISDFLKRVTPITKNSFVFKSS